MIPELPFRVHAASYGFSRRLSLEIIEEFLITNTTIGMDTI